MVMTISKSKTTFILATMIWSLGSSSPADTSVNKWSTTKRRRSHSTVNSRKAISVRAAPRPSISSTERATHTSACSRTLTIEWSALRGLALCLPSWASLRSCYGSATRKSSSIWASRRWWETIDHSTSAWPSVYLRFPYLVAAAVASRRKCTSLRKNQRLRKKSLSCLSTTTRRLRGCKKEKKDRVLRRRLDSNQRQPTMMNQNGTTSDLLYSTDGFSSSSSSSSYFTWSGSWPS